MELKMKTLAFGEVLWDIFGDDYEIGGASFNFSAHTARLKQEAYLVSAVGKDDLGDKALSKMKELQIKTDFIGRSEYPTGSCIVTLNDKREPDYNLIKNVAWDYINAEESLLNRAENQEFDLFYFGTLSQRNIHSRKTLNKLINHGKFTYIVCDLNLRQNFYNKDLVEECLALCNCLKLNREEFKYLQKILHTDNKEDMFYKLFDEYGIRIVILTLDKDGAIVFDGIKNIFHKTSVQKTAVISAVGGGDSFCACFFASFIKDNDIAAAAEKASVLSSFVVSHYGAVPEYTNQLLEKIL